MEKPVGTPLNSDTIEHFLGGDYQQADGIVVHIDDLNSSPDPLAERFAVIVFLPPVDGTVGHFCLLSEMTGYLEWFDSTAKPIPPQVQQYATTRNMAINYSTKALQGRRSNTCGKWCIARMHSLPTPLNVFDKIFRGNKYLSPDEIVDQLIVLKWKQ